MGRRDLSVFEHLDQSLRRDRAAVEIALNLVAPLVAED
jgi:hypothetical protein